MVFKDLIFVAQQQSMRYTSFMKKHSNISAVFGYEEGTKTSLPLYVSGLRAGFPSPADDYIEKKLDLNEYLVKHPAATFYVKVEGDSMLGAGIMSGDILVVDRAIEAVHNKIVVAILDGEFTVKRLLIKGAKIVLAPENDAYQAIDITEGMDFAVWGVVTSVIHEVV